MSSAAKRPSRLRTTGFPGGTSGGAHPRSVLPDECWRSSRKKGSLHQARRLLQVPRERYTPACQRPPFERGSGSVWFGASGPLLVSVSGAPPTPRHAGSASSWSTARAPAIFSRACHPHHGRRGRIRGRRAVRQGRRATQSAWLIVPGRSRVDLIAVSRRLCLSGDPTPPRVIPTPLRRRAMRTLSGRG